MMTLGLIITLLYVVLVFNLAIYIASKFERHVSVVGEAYIFAGVMLIMFTLPFTLAADFGVTS